MSQECHFYTSHYVASGPNYYYLGNATFIKLYIMILSQSQKDKISARLSNLECPVCGGRHLSLNNATSHILCSEVPGPRIDIEDFKVAQYPHLSTMRSRAARYTAAQMATFQQGMRDGKDNVSLFHGVNTNYERKALGHN